MKPTVILVGADKGGVGKTTLARTLLDYLSRKNVMARCYDTEWPRGTLKRFYPEGERVRLQPSNRAMAPLFVPAGKVRVQGVAVGLMRRF